MFCPQCRTEYREGVVTCRSCGVELVAELPPEPEAEWAEFVTVFETGDAALFGVVKSLFQAEGIPCATPGVELQDLVGTGTIQIQVPREYQEQARALLAELPPPEEGEDGDESRS
jgi:hypothetical protein